MFSNRRVAMLCAGVLGAVACDPQPPRQPPSAADLARYSRDSAQFVIDSAKAVHDAYVIDSISHAISTDSLYRLERALLTTTDPQGIEHAILCETDHLFTVYGRVPASRAMDRMTNTLYTRSERYAAEAVYERNHDKNPAMGLSYREGTYNCGQESWGPPMPEVYEGTRTGVIPTGPPRPRRPTGVRRP